MSTSLIDELEVWLRTKSSTDSRRQDAKLVQFLAIRTDVAQALEKGYTLRTLHEFLSETGKITTRYETFRRYVAIHIRNTEKTKMRNKATGSAARAAPTGLATFTHHAQPNKGELL